MRVLAYTRVSTADQRDSGLGIAAQRATIAAEADRRGWTSVEWVTDAGYSAKSMNRPGVSAALAALRAGEADVLVVARIDRLSRSMIDFATVMQAASTQGWAFVSLDLGVDTSSPNGRLMANLFAAFAEFEKELIRQRTREALAAAKARGVRLGRPRDIQAPLLARISAMRGNGLSLRQIAGTLNDEGVPTVRGGRCWHPATIRGLLASAAMEEVMAS